MSYSSKTIISILSLSFWLMMEPVFAQVIFRVDSPIKRHNRSLFQSLEAVENGAESSIGTDSLGFEPFNQRPADAYVKANSLGINSVPTTVRPNPAISKKPPFLVTYMGTALPSDTSGQRRYRLLPVENYPTGSSQGSPVRSLKRFTDQDSVMVAVLEDSLRRIRSQLVPLRESTQKSAKSIFDRYRSIPSILPVRLGSLNEFRVSSAYGLRVHPISGRPQNHEGIDLPQPRYTAVFATADGIVDRVIWQPNGLGLAVFIVHPSGYQTGYGHLEDHSVLVGDVVRRGQMIGRVGSTGLSTGPHLHYTVLVGSQPVDPAAYCFLLLNALQEPLPSVRQPARSAVQQRR